MALWPGARVDALDVEMLALQALDAVPEPALLLPCLLVVLAEVVTDLSSIIEDAAEQERGDRVGALKEERKQYLDGGHGLSAPGVPDVDVEQLSESEHSSENDQREPCGRAGETSEDRPDASAGRLSGRLRAVLEEITEAVERTGVAGCPVTDLPECAPDRACGPGKRPRYCVEDAPDVGDFRPGGRAVAADHGFVGAEIVCNPLVECRHVYPPEVDVESSSLNSTTPATTATTATTAAATPRPPNSPSELSEFPREGPPGFLPAICCR